MIHAVWPQDDVVAVGVVAVLVDIVAVLVAAPHRADLQVHLVGGAQQALRPGDGLLRLSLHPGDGPLRPGDETLDAVLLELQTGPGQHPDPHLGDGHLGDGPLPGQPHLHDPRQSPHAPKQMGGGAK